MGLPVVLVGSHLGFPMDRTPLGGGGMVGVELARRWAAEARIRLRVVGAGPAAPAGDYVQATPGAAEPSSLGEFAYARFCRRFEREATALLLGRNDRAAAVVNDISESPDLARLAESGLPIVSIWHVDVVEFFSKMYLKGALSPERAVRWFERVRRTGAERLVPDLLRLVYAKQRASVLCSDKIVLPSEGMAETLLACYGALAPNLERKIVVQPWGSIGVEGPVGEDVRARHGIGSEVPVVMTMSRISPEKGLGRLFDALDALDRRREEGLAVFVCGAPAFMGGRRELSRLRRRAARFRRTRVVFPGYVSGGEKRAYLAAADLFAATSHHESYGLAVAEALSAGVPVIATENHGVRQLIRPAWGRAVPPEGLAEALEELLSDRPRLKAMGEAARGSVPPFERAAERLAETVLSLAEAAA